MFRYLDARFPVGKYISQISSRFKTTASGKATIRPIKPGKRTPLIKFGRRHDMAKGAKTSVASGKIADGKKSKGPVMEDWELPMRYRRKLLEKDEIEYINRGGPA